MPWCAAGWTKSAKPSEKRFGVDGLRLAPGDEPCALVSKLLVLMSLTFMEMLIVE